MTLMLVHLLCKCIPLETFDVLFKSVQLSNNMLPNYLHREVKKKLSFGDWKVLTLCQLFVNFSFLCARVDI